MLFNRQRRSLDVNLLHDADEMAVTAQAATTTRTCFEEVFLEVRHLLRWKRLAIVLGVARLAADLTGLAALRTRSRGRFDDIRGRWFGRSRRILLSRRQLLLETHHLGPQRLVLRGQGFKLSPQ